MRPAATVLPPMMFRPTRLTACLAAVLLAVPCFAQTGATKSLGTGKGSGKLLTREELRACLDQQKALGSRKTTLQAQNDTLERDRAQFERDEAALVADREAIDKFKASAEDLNRRSQALTEQVADYNERVRKFQAQGSSISGPAAERQQQALERDKAALDKTAKELDAERAGFAPKAEALSTAYNTRVEQRNRAADDWNARNAQFKRDSQAFDAELQAWRADCEGRPYREDDEKAIQAGR